MVRMKSRDDKAQRCFFNAACHYGLWQSFIYMLKMLYRADRFRFLYAVKGSGMHRIVTEKRDMSTSSSFYAHSKVSALLVLQLNAHMDPHWVLFIAYSCFFFAVCQRGAGWRALHDPQGLCAALPGSAYTASTQSQNCGADSRSGWHHQGWVSKNKSCDEGCYA